ncbi:ATV_HP_G0047120.mRNA.1.CDS.1 [Saccharomyces cerevisiae]|nr:ATV_HP_G0098370.mRNA.1.CDS.1 [Saccharomyces cerevisiae]CAI4947241.1 ATV_HP_G0100630.mRNA.1.CDS.1 [Saccharomyces cerevisiae]CAI4990738.1 ATV_HP_G0132550.mRNA.1.CDS.1 [Saccharomyces cerevisiae]CAI5126353.1 ATV_HP_G0047120.mRNA.1.CDS.1 [Saccharomyces cerevisiae]CAI6570708.1 ATV_HP_G0098370.mRNA.1.CDS.1 [Saccharomyces cerevisiae]
MVLETLKQGLDSSQIHEALIQLDSYPREPVDLDASMVLIKFVIPVYPSLPERSKVILRRLASKSFTFLCQIVTFSRTISGRDGLQEIRIYQEILEDIISFEPGCLTFYLKASTTSKADRDSIKALFFGSKLFNVLANRIDMAKYLGYLRLQWKFLLENNETDPPGFLGEWLVSSFLLNPVLAADMLLGELFLLKESYFSSFQKIISASSLIDQKRLIAKFLLPYIQVIVTLENLNDVRKILRRFDLDKIISLSVLFEIQSLPLKEVIVRLMSNHSSTKFVSALVSKFADFTDEEVDTKTCELLVLFAVHNLNHSQREEIAHDERFLNGVTKHLGSNEREARERAMFIAKLLSGGHLKYESDFKINIPNVKFESNSDDKIIDFQSLKNPSICNTQTDVGKDKITEVSGHVQSLTLDCSDSDDEDDNDEREIVKRIVFLKDLMKEYEKTGESRKAPLIPLLKQTVKLIRQKADFQLEVGYYAQGILSSIVCLNNEFDEPLFEQWRINALASILVVLPEKVSGAINILFNSELSLQQRMSLLSALGLSARELRGLDDPTIVKPKFDFPTNRLPWDDQSHHNSRLVEVQESTSMIKKTKTVWKSRKLGKDREKGTQNRFRKYTGLFFYPLAHGWLNGIDVGTYNQLFKSHYLTTLRIIYSCANPVHDFESMTELMNHIISSAIEEGIPLNKG